jgi:TDG/mug DNA glycosylase family protein
MDAVTHRIYAAHAASWIAARRPNAIEDGRLAAFARRIRRDGLVADLGCGPGWYAARLLTLGFRVVAVDLATAMLEHVAQRAPGVRRVCADLAALPFADRTLDGAWAENCYCHLPAAELPQALASLHRALRPGAPMTLSIANREWKSAPPATVDTDEIEKRFDDGDLPGRLFTFVTARRARALLHGAGFGAVRVESAPDAFWLRLLGRRARRLPDLVRPGLRLLICGLNPSLYSADRGVPFARPGNRFWPAAVRAGLVTRERDPLDAFRRGIGTTDLVKRATASATELRPREYAAGLARVEGLVRRYRPAATCFVGLDGWRCSVDRRAQPGWIAGGFGGRPAYLMPSTSGRNARVPLDELARHLHAAAHC